MAKDIIMLVTKQKYVPNLKRFGQKVGKNLINAFQL